MAWKHAALARRNWRTTSIQLVCSASSAVACRIWSFSFAHTHSHILFGSGWASKPCTSVCVNQPEIAGDKSESLVCCAETFETATTATDGPTPLVAQGTPVIIAVLLFILQKVCDNVLSFSIREQAHPTHKHSCPSAVPEPHHCVAPETTNFRASLLRTLLICSSARVHH